MPVITNIFSDSDLRQVLADISADSGVPIIADATVQGAVTLDLKAVPLERALAMLLRGGGYTFRKIDDYYLVGVPDPANPNFPLLCPTEIIPLNFIPAAQMYSALSDTYSRFLRIEGNVGGERRDTRTGASRSASTSSSNAALFPTYRLIVTAPPAILARIKEEIALLDVAPSQVMLEALVVEVSEDGLKELGVDWATRWIRQENSASGITLVYSELANTELVKLTTLIQNGRARLRANPRVATIDGQTAELEVGRENYFAITSGPVTYPYTTLEKITSGISLRITPRVAADGVVVARIEPEVRDVTGKAANDLPEITYRRAATQARVRDGQSVVIGGLINEYTMRTVRRVPILGDIPVIKHLFRRVSTRQMKSEVLIVVTPRIIRDGNEEPLTLPDAR
jgi:type II secretory pathway component GspD/PulD (secretin)